MDHAQIPVLVPAFHSAGVSLESTSRVFNDAVETLRELPDTVNGLVAFLEDIGVKGIPSSGAHCVLVRYLKDSVQPDDGITVRILYGALHVECGTEGVEHVYNLPYHLAKFTKDFDSGRYPQLERGK